MSGLVNGQDSYVIEYLGLQDGLPSLRVDAITQDQQGLIWIASFATGLLRYDGTHFKVLNHTLESTPRLSSHHISDVITDAKGRLWIAHRLGIDVMLPHSLEITHRIPLSAEDKTAKGAAQSLYLAPNGDIWVATINNGVFRFPGGDPDLVVQADSLPGALYINQTLLGEVYCVSITTGMHVLVEGHFRPTFPSHKYEENQRTLIKPTENQDGLLCGFQWQLPDERVLTYRYDLATKRFELGVPTDGIATELVPKFIQKKQEKIIDQVKSRPAFNHPFRLFKDNRGVIWIAAVHGGILKLRRKQLQFTVCPELAGRSMRGMLELPDGTIYAGTYDGLFHYFPLENRAVPLGKNKKVHFFQILEAKGDTITGLSESRNGLMCYVLPPPWHISLPRIIQEDIGPGYFAFLPLEPDWVLLGNQKIFRFRLSDWQTEPFSILPVHANVETYCFKRTRDGRIWLGTTEGVFVLSKNGQLELSLPRLDHRLGEQSRVNDIFEDKWGRLWFATSQYGLLCYDPVTQHIQAYDSFSGFVSNETYKIASSHGGDVLWVSTVSGLQCVELKLHQIHFFNEFDGTSGSEFNTGSFLEARDGSLYFGGVMGLTRFNPEDFQALESPPINPFVTTLFIEDVFSNKVSTLHFPPQDTLLKLSAGQNTLRFHFGSNDYFRPKTSTCYVRLMQVDQQWISLGNEKSVKYYRLPSGNYTLQVRINDNLDKSVSQIYTINFTIDSVFYKKWWFSALLTLGIAGIVLGYFRLRHIRLRNDEKLRRTIAYNLHNTIGAKISSISNMLHVISRLNEKKEPFQQELNHLIEQARKAHSTMSDAIWVLSQPSNTAQGLVLRMEDYADKWLRLAHIKVVFEQNIADIEKNIPFTVQHDLILIFKEVLGNILKHTFSEQVYISFLRNSDKSISLRVKNWFSERKKDVPSSGQGIAMMQEYMQRIGGTLTVAEEEHSFEIIIWFEKPFKKWR
jgi:ligand-binding sensor domain-containing protein/two-component sensor histidine kinase